MEHWILAEMERHTETFDDGYVDGIYILKLNQDICSKNVQAFVNMYWVCI